MENINKEITFFLPCRSGSQRVPNKNTKRFANEELGLVGIKLKQLLAIPKVNILLSTNDQSVIEIAKALNNRRILIDNRPDELCSSATSTDDLISYVPTIIKKGIVFWTHVTSPFADEKFYNHAIETYFSQIKKGYDSLMSVTPLRKFLWDENGAISYDRNIEKWPRTQTINPLYEINSAAFVADIDIYKKLNDRIGKKPFLFETDEIVSFDIDWPIDFEIGEKMWKEYGHQ